MGVTSDPDPREEEQGTFWVELGWRGRKGGMRAGAYGRGMVGEIASQKGSRPPTSYCSKNTPILGLGQHSGPPAGHMRLYAARSGSRALNSAFVASRADRGSWVGAGCAPGLAAGRQQADHGPGIGAGKRLALKTRNCSL